MPMAPPWPTGLWAYVGGAAAGHGEGSWGVPRDGIEKPRARRWWGRPSACQASVRLGAVGERARCGSAKMRLALVRRFCLEEGCVCGGWLPLALAGFFLPHPDRLPPPLVCPGRPFSARRASATASNVPRWLLVPAAAADRVVWAGVTAKPAPVPAHALLFPPPPSPRSRAN